MHDCKGRELKVGDRVMVPCEVVSIQATADYCNASMKTLATMGPEHRYKTYITLNTQMLLRANEGDDLTFTHVVEGTKETLK